MEEEKMNINQTLRLLAGTMILLTVILTYFVSINWLLLGVFIGLNLIQSAFTKTCPAAWFFKKLGVKGEL